MSNAGERKDVRALEKLAKQTERQRLEVTVMIMSTTPGREWMLNKLERSHIFASSMTGDPLQTAFNEGERNIGLQDLNDIMRCCPDQYILMMQERNARDAARERALTQHNGSENDGRDVEGSDDTADGPDANLGSDVYQPAAN